MGERWAPKNGAHLFFLKKMGDPKKKKDGLKNGLRKFKIEFLKKVKKMRLRAKNITRLSPLGVPKKKKDGRSMGNVPKSAHQIKIKKMGCQKKKRWGNAHLFEVNFWRPSFAYP